MTTPAPVYRFMVNNISQAGTSRVTVNFTQVDPTYDPSDPNSVPNSGGFVNSLSLNMPTADGKGYFPGDLHDMTLTLVSRATLGKKDSSSSKGSK